MRASLPASMQAFTSRPICARKRGFVVLAARMYRGEKISRSARVKKQDSEHHSELGGAVPTDTLQDSTVAVDAQK